MTDLPAPFDSAWMPMIADLSDGLAVVNSGPEWRIVYANPALGSMLGRAAEDLLGASISEVIPTADPPKLIEQLEDALRGDASRTTVSHELFSSNGATQPVELRLHRLVIDGKPFIGMILRGSRVAPRQKNASENSRRDPLTRLPERTALMSRLDALLRGDRAADRQFAVLFIDLDNFKQVNDAYGHLVGDRVLGEVARRLAGCVRAGDLVVRFGGDEFVALVERVSGFEEIQPVVERIHTAFAEPFSLPAGEAKLSVSVGVAEASVEHHTPDDLLRDADRAMYALKRMPK
jgi:diguanylate cyclase (GGDEF)-like protein/PAS domain S-box-containing protein